MKAFAVTHYGADGLEQVDVATPTTGAGDVLVDIRAASINPLDKTVRNGEFKRLLKYKPPFVLGHDVAGVVTEVGSAVSEFAVGDEVFAHPRDLRIGTFAETIAIDASLEKSMTVLKHGWLAISLVGPPGCWLRHPARAAAPQAGHRAVESRSPFSRKETRRPLLVRLHAGKWFATREARHLV